jgi:pimeloyl-ACP methyl ester carboxylesterase
MTATDADTTTPDLDHRLVPSREVRLHVALQGDGPLVLMVHGFPEGWRSWRHQLPALAAAGFTAAALDVRGYGRSSVPVAVEAYRMLAMVADVVAVVRGLGHETATVVGHDWGSPIAATTALLRPDVVRAVGLLGVPYTPPGGPRPTSVFAQAGGDEDFYVSAFQEPGRAEAEIEPDVRGWLAGFHAALGPGGRGDVFTIPPGGRMRDRFPELDAAPPWLGDEQLDVAAAELERTGLTGALNRYRNVDRDWEDLQAWEGLPVRQPSLFLAGAEDASVGWLAPAIEAHATTLPGLVASHLVPGAGHWVHQERPEAVTAALLDLLAQS